MHVIEFFLSDCLTSLQLPLNTNVLYSEKIEIDSFLLILWTVLHSGTNQSEKLKRKKLQFILLITRKIISNPLLKVDNTKSSDDF